MLSLVLLLLCGCSSEGQPRISAGFESLRAYAYDEALESFALAREEGEDPQQAIRGEGMVYLSMGEYEQAAEKFLESLRQGGGIPVQLDYDTNYYLAECYMKLERYEDAIAVYDAILALRRRDADAWYLRGLARLRTGDTEHAREDLYKAMELEPENYDRMLLVYEAFVEAGLEEEGALILSRAMEKESVSMTNYEKGRMSYYLGNNAQAQSFLEQARNDRDADKEAVTLLLGQTAQRQEDYNYAVSVYRTFLAEESNHPQIWNQLGLCLTRMGEYDGAIEAFEAGRALEGNDCLRELTRNQVAAYEYSSRFQEARMLMEQYLRSWPDDEEAKREYIFLSTR